MDYSKSLAYPFHSVHEEIRSRDIVKFLISTFPNLSDSETIAFCPKRLNTPNRFNKKKLMVDFIYVNSKNQ